MNNTFMGMVTLKYRLFLASAVLFFCSWSVQAQTNSNSGNLFSPSVGQKFHEIAYELGNSPDAGQDQLDQAITLLAATLTLDNRADYIVPDIIKFACRHTSRNYSDLIYRLLVKYVDESADLEVTAKAVRYLLEQLDSREQREKLLAILLNELGSKNASLDSELSTLLGLLMAEKADFQAASFFFMRAFNKNEYNRLAFQKLAELIPEQIEPIMYLEHLRRSLGENPQDIENAIAFARYAQHLQLYQIAADAYKYCADLFRFLYPDQALPPQIYLSWAISCYNTQRNQHTCLQIAEEMRKNGQFDLILEAIAAKAAAKIGNYEQADQIFRDAEERAIDLFLESEETQTPAKPPPPLQTQPSENTVSAEKLAWFYCFAFPDPGKALDWANKAYATDSESSNTAALLAYALVMNNQTDWAKPLIENYGSNKIISLALAQIQLQQQDKDEAIKHLKLVIESDPGSLESELAGQLLAGTGGYYISPIDPNITRAALQSRFGQSVVPPFVSPEKAISFQLNIKGSKFSYNNEFSAAVVITNNSAEPLVISDNGFINGNIRIDADVTGDIKQKIPGLVAAKIRPSLPVKPGASLIIPVRLVTAELRRIMLTYPQAALDIQFTVYLDPVNSPRGLTNRLPGLQPAKVPVRRPGVNLSGRFLRNRFNTLADGQQGQKIQITKLFAGLLAEQNVMANQEPLYKFMYADWMPNLLKSALVHNLTDNDWIVKTHTMAAMLALPLDYELTNTVAENLNDGNWPVRLMAVYLLAKTQQDNFKKVLDWTAKYDSNNMVRKMAIALGAAEPEKPPLSPTDDQEAEIETNAPVIKQ